MVDDATVKAHICALRIKELTECLDRLGMKKSGRKDDLARRLLTVIDDANSLSATGASSRGMPQVEATRRVVEEVYARMVGERGGRSVHTLAYADAPSAPSGSTANGGVPTPNTANPLGASGATSQLRTHHAHPPQPPLSYQPPMRSSAPSSFTSSHAPGTSATAAAAAGGGRPFVPNALGFLPVQYSQLNSNSGGTSGSRAGTQQAPSTSGHTGVGSSFAAGVVRCICEHPVTRTTDMLQCSNCKVLQHARCVIKPDARSATHMCERCRAERIDPYWEVVSADVMPAFKLVPTGKSAYVGTKLEPLQSAERTFTITPQQYELFKKRPNHKLQVVCMQIGDPVPYRCIWPMASDLKVNGLQLQVYNRAAHSKVGRNQRDEPANIGVLCHPTRNRISMGCTDPSSYVLLLQIVKQRTMEDVKRLTKPPLPLSEAIERVKQEIKSSDEDIEVDQAVVSLKCPLSGMRMKTPARFSEIPGLMFFDLDTFLSVVQRSRKWQCPNSMRNSSVFTLQVDSFMASILSSLRNLPDVAEVQISPEGQWRPVGGPGAKGSGSTWPWIDAGVAADALPVPNAPPAGQPQIKPEVKEEPGGGGRPSTGGNSEEEDADAELKKAAQAMQAQQRQAQAMQSELIVLDDSSDDDAAPASKRPRPDPPAPPQPPAPHHPTPTHPTPQHPIRVRIRPPSSLPGQPPTHPSLQPPNPHPTHTLPTLDHNNPSTSSHPSHSPAPLSLPPGAPLGSSAPTPPTLTSSTFPANPTLAHSLQFPPPTPLPPNTVHQPPQGPIPPNNPHTAAAAAAAAAAVRTSAAMGGSSTLPQPPSNLTSMSSPLPAMGAADANSRPSAFQHLTSHNQLLQLQQQHQHHQHVQLLQQLQRARDQQHQNLHSSALSSPSDSLMSTHPSPHPPTFPHPPGAPPSRSLTPHLPPPSSQPQQQQHPTSLPFPHLPPGIPNPSASLPMPGLPLHSPLLGSMPGSTFPSRSPSAQPPTMPGGYFTGLDVKAPSSVPFAPPPPSASQQPPQQQAQQQNHDTEVIVIDSD